MSSKNAITIRQALATDASTIHQMVQELAQALGMADHARGTVDDFLKYGFSENAFFSALIAERDGEAVGMCTYFSIFSSWSGRPGIFVLDLFITENERGSGLGEILLAKVAEIGHKNGAAFLRLSVDNHNVRGQDFYNRLGFSSADNETTLQIGSEQFIALATQDRKENS